MDTCSLLVQLWYKRPLPCTLPWVVWSFAFVEFPRFTTTFLLLFSRCNCSWLKYSNPDLVCVKGKI